MDESSSSNLDEIDTFSLDGLIKFTNIFNIKKLERDLAKQGLPKIKGNSGNLEVSPEQQNFNKATEAFLQCCRGYTVGNYRARIKTGENEGFIYLSPINGILQDENPQEGRRAKLVKDSDKSKGIKLHISIDDPPNDNTKNLERAWNIIMPILIHHDVQLFKIIRPDKREQLYNDQKECGKEITIYVFKEDLVRHITEYSHDTGLHPWGLIIEMITHALAEAGIRPAQLPSSDFAIKGTNYFSYRNDKDGKPCGFDKLELSQIDNQPDRVPGPYNRTNSIHETQFNESKEEKTKNKDDKKDDSDQNNERCLLM